MIGIQGKKIFMGRISGAPNRSNLMQNLEKYATWLFASLIFIVSVVVLYIGNQVGSPYKDICISISTSLIASLIFSFMYSSLVEKHHLAVVNDELASSVRHSAEEMKKLQQDNMQQITNSMISKIEDLEQSHYHQITTHFRELIPSKQFPATNQPDPEFNRTLTEALIDSNQYLFKGVTGRYVPSRLETARNYNLSCRVLLVDPARDDLLQLYVRDRFGVYPADLTQRIQKVKREIYMTIVDLFEQAQRTRTTINIKMYHGPVYYRTEIFDDKVFVSYFTQKTSTAYPNSYLYTSDSFYYEAFLTDFNQTFELDASSTSFNSMSHEKQLVEFLAKIGCDVNEIPQLQQEAKEFRQNFLKML